MANALGTEVFDTDVAIERDTGRTIPDIFGTDGEPAFRAIEERIVLDALATQTGVVSLGGGAILSQRTRSALQGHTVVYLEISVGEGLRRTGTHTSRPLLAGGDPRAKYRELMRRRRPLYRGVATVRVRTDGRSPARVVAQILTKLGVEPPENAAAPVRTPRPAPIPLRRKGIPKPSDLHQERSK
ncbi:shikimate kinase [Rhodococcoides trifolii]|uniref:Shikimate kinase n=1 Tax=Rhodococcoides trifolii TaxID=908250 RepID=A0A917FWC0_9NOCA|nr:shikimate kinase [Rhodococcus trifolii]